MKGPVERIMKMTLADVTRCILEINPEIKKPDVVANAYHKLHQFSKDSGIPIQVFLAAMVYSLWDVATDLEEMLMPAEATIKAALDNSSGPHEFVQNLRDAGFQVIVMDEDENAKC